MDLGEKLKDQMKGMSEAERKEMAEMMDKELDDYLDRLESSSSKYEDGWSEENWEEEMANHPFFAKSGDLKEGQELSPLMKGIQDLKYSAEENSPEELAKNYKDDGNFNFKVLLKRAFIRHVQDSLWGAFILKISVHMAKLATCS